jgi:hypothetical protein
LLDRLDRTANLLSHKQIVLAGTTGYAEYERQGRLRKSGIFGFEGEVLFVDPKVEWISELVIFACSTILRSMSDEQSPIFWKKTISPVFQATNRYLVDLFDKLLIETETAVVSDNAAKRQDSQNRQEQIKHEIFMLIGS